MSEDTLTASLFGQWEAQYYCEDPIKGNKA